ncbi:speckle-type POZ protein-like [Orussus abietinus]|uniref:speckle-type POZ protein-like n=1 Tax=Orussus abietinus TaxID=222816 RepID=UPI000625EDF9|nr:speckle-type POZ protein-like [Orussus abietinus]
MLTFNENQSSSGEVHFLLPYDTTIYNTDNELISDHLKVSFTMFLPSCSNTKFITFISEQPYENRSGNNCVNDRDESIQFSLTEKSFDLINFQVKDKTFSASKTLVAAHSVVFYKKLKHDEAKRNFTVEDVDPEIFQELLNFMHVDKYSIKNIEDIAEKLFEAANIYGVRGLQALCAKVLSKNLSDGNCMSMLSIAVLNKIEDLKFKAVSYFKKNCESTVVKDEFKSLLRSNPENMSKVLCAICSLDCHELNRIERTTYTFHEKKPKNN